jgi:DNA-3-methyladenine glycosylase II
MQHINRALKHLKKDKTLAKVIKNFPEPKLKRGEDYFGALVESIIYQQLAGKAAMTIFGRFKSLFLGGLTPKKVLKLSDEQFRSAGISGQKMGYLRDLSAKFLDGTVGSSDFDEMSDENVKNHLVSVKGIGPWTADMFLIFTLNRPDILPTGDLGIQKGFKEVFNLRTLPDAKKMENLASAWRPHRTVASLYLWMVADKKKEN